MCGKYDNRNYRRIILPRSGHIYNKMIGIYKITNPNNKVYIGQTVDIERRKKEYKNPNKQKQQSQPKICDSLKKYNFENHIFEVLEECLIEQLDEKEIFYKQQFINEYGWQNALFCHIIDGKGGYKSKETRQKMSNYALNRTKIHNKKISDKLKGYKQTPEHLLNRSEAVKGKKFRSKIVNQYDLVGNFIKEWSTAKEACLFYNPKDLNGVSACCLGKQKTAFGYKWKYKNN